MSAINWSTPEKTTPTPARHVKHEPISPRIPSPAHSSVTTATTLLRPGRPPSPAPSCSTTVLLGGGHSRAQISIRPLSSILDPDDQMSVVSGPVAGPSSVVVSPKSELSSNTVTSAQSVKDDESDWRYSIKNVKDRLKFIYETDDQFQDVTFEVEGKDSKQQFKAHKLILRIASPVFDRICGNNTTSQAFPSIVVVKDVEPKIFGILLKFIYTDEIDATDFDLLPLLKAAQIYGVRQLYLECVKSIKLCMTDEVAVKLCDIAASWDEQLLEAALDHIANKAFKIFKSDDFTHLSVDIVHRLLTRNDLRIDEVTLFECIVKWGETKCSLNGLQQTPANLRKVMQLLIPEVRFPLMGREEFTLIVAPTQLLTYEEQVGIFQYLCVDKTMQNKLPPISFKTTPRLSKKCLDLDTTSGSSSDYREASSASPEQMQRQPSVAYNELVDFTTTEAESETASNVSTFSETQTKSRKYERSHSHSSGASSTKRRKLNSEKSDRKRSEKVSKHFSLDNLFRDFDNSKRIELKDTTISLNSFISQISRHERRHEIEAIKFDNVLIEDSKQLGSRKVYFKRLKKFELNIQIEEPINSVISENSFVLEKYMFFDLGSNEWLYENLWKTRIDITIIINKNTILRLSHEDVILNKFNGAPRILKSLKEQHIKSLVYSHTKFTERYFPLSMTRLVILGVPVSSNNMSSFLKQFKHLKELTVVSPVVNAGTVSVLSLDADFSSKSMIKKLSLGFFELHMADSSRFYNIVELSLRKITWQSNFEERFNHFFPKLEKFYLVGPGEGSPKLLQNILKIASLKIFVNWSCDFRLLGIDGDGIEQKKILINADVSEPYKNFILEKTGEKGKWVGSKIKFKKIADYVYRQFEYQHIFEDVTTFNLKYNK